MKMCFINLSRAYKNPLKEQAFEGKVNFSSTNVGVSVQIFFLHSANSILVTFYHDSLRPKIFKAFITSLFEGIWVSN